MKSLLAGLCLFAATLATAPPGRAAPDTLVGSFGDDGVALLGTLGDEGLRVLTRRLSRQ